MSQDDVSDNSGPKPGLHTRIFDQRQSNLRKYQAMTLGTTSWLALLRYELTILLVGGIPGALGLLLRKYLYRPLFRHVGRNVIFGRHLTLRHPHKISLGDNVIIDEGSLLDAKGEDNSGISIGDGFTLGRFSALVCKNGDIHIGSNVNIGSSVKIIVGEKGKIQIGNSLDIGSACHFSAGSYDYSRTDRLPSTQRVATRGIVVEDMAWIGAGVIVLDGICIGRQSIVGAGSVVTTSIPAQTVAAGVPAQVVKQREQNRGDNDAQKDETHRQIPD